MCQTARFQHFALLLTVRERERRDCLVAKTIYFNITKLLRPRNIANGAQNPFEEIKFIIIIIIILLLIKNTYYSRAGPRIATAHLKFTHSTF